MIYPVKHTSMRCPGASRDNRPLSRSPAVAKAPRNVATRGEFVSQWIGLRENLQETMVFTIKYRGFL